MAHKKLRILYLARLFYEGSDQEHPLSMEDILTYLYDLGIPAERKAVYDDLELLRQFGMDIVYVRGKAHRYYLGQREFQLPELKLLIDVVQSSPFLTVKKSMELIRKLEGLASRAQAVQLRRQVYVLDRVKTHNEQLYYNIDGASTPPSSGTSASASATLTGPRRADVCCATAAPGMTKAPWPWRWTAITTSSPTGLRRRSTSISGWTGCRS